MGVGRKGSGEDMGTNKILGNDVQGGSTGGDYGWE